MSIENLPFSHETVHVAETEDDLVTFKIRPEDKRWAEDQQRRLSRARAPGSAKVTQAELFALMKRRCISEDAIAWLDDVIQRSGSTALTTISETSAAQPAYNPAIQYLLDIAVDPKRLEAVETVLRDIADAALEPHGTRPMHHPEVIEIKAGSTRQKLDDCLRRIKELADQGRSGAAYFAQGDDPGASARGGKSAKNRR